VQDCHDCAIFVLRFEDNPSVLQILLSEHTTVIACARSPESASVLQELKAQHKDRLQLVTLDVADTSSIHVRQWMHTFLCCPSSAQHDCL